MKITTIILYLLGFCLLFFGCSEVEVPLTNGVAPEGKTVTLSMRLPQISVPRGRGLTEQQEYAISSIHAIAFNTATKKYICSRLVTDIVSTTNYKKTGNLLLPDEADVSTLLFVANVNYDVISKINSFNSNTTLAEAITQVKEAIAETNTPTYLPMLGQANIVENTTSLAVTLTRMVARVNVQVNEGQGNDDFKLKEVYIYDGKNQTLAFTGLTDGQESVFENTAYIKPRGAGKTKVVIGAKVNNGQTQYYALSFIPSPTAEQLAIIENHSYTFNIKISGKIPAGATTPEEALTINTTVLFDLKTIDDSWHNIIVTDECNILCLSEDEFTISRSGGDLDFLIFTDNSSGWTLDGDLPEGISLYTKGSTQTCTDGKKDTNYYLTLSVDETNAPRSLTFTVRAGFLTHTVTINQQ